VVDEDRKMIPIQNLQKGIYIIKVLENEIPIDSQKLVRL